MKYLLILSAFVCFSVHAKDVKDLNKAILQDVKTDIQKDEDKFKKPSRHPASVNEATDAKIEEPQKIDKIRQIGPNQW